VGTTFTENERYRHSQVRACVHTGWLKKCESTMGKMERPATMTTEETRKCCWYCSTWRWNCTDERKEIISSYSQSLGCMLLFKNEALRVRLNSIEATWLIISTSTCQPRSFPVLLLPW